MTLSPSVTVLTPVPSPYQVELFNALAAEGSVRLRVVYLLRRHDDRQWKMPDILHPHAFWENGPVARSINEQAIDSADLVVFSYYANPAARLLIRRRTRSQRPWVYWGERPGFGGWGWVGQLRRRLLLAPLHRAAFPIWGMGKWAIDAWRQEFGDCREYQNIPYFSDLDRFVVPRTHSRPSTVRRFLFSGSFIRRKGIDLLAEAFIRVASSRPGVRLDLIGAGELESMVRARLARYESQVRFHGFSQWQELPAYYRDAHILVAPSRYDGWGLIVPEGLAAGMPVISTDQTGAAIDLLRPGKTGWIVPAGDVTALMRAMSDAADLSPNRLSEMSAAAQASVADHTLAHGVRRFTEAVRSALAAVAM
jgi:glycosyltransferase involved in cell wall biosynthesis